jgi:hypothetical protein
LGTNYLSSSISYAFCYREYFIGDRGGKVWKRGIMSLDNIKLQNDYRFITDYLHPHVKFGLVKDDEFEGIRDTTIRSLYPERFSYINKMFICAECGIFELGTKAVANKYSSERDWVCYKQENSEGIASILACSEICYDKIIGRLKQYGTIK